MQEDKAKLATEVASAAIKARVGEMLNWLYKIDPENVRYRSLTGNNSDHVVHINSQRNTDGSPDHPNAGAGEVIAHTVHSGETLNTHAETRSVFIYHRIKELLSRDSTEMLQEGLDQ